MVCPGSLVQCATGARLKCIFMEEAKLSGGIRLFLSIWSSLCAMLY